MSVDIYGIPRTLMGCWSSKKNLPPAMTGGGSLDQFKEFCATDEQLKNLDVNEDNYYDIMQSIPSKKFLKWSASGFENHKFILGLLSEREAKVVIMYFNLDGHGFRSLNKIGEFFGVSHSNIGRIKDDALRKLRSKNAINLCRAFDDAMLNCTLENYSQFTSDKMNAILVGENGLVDKFTEEELKLYNFVIDQVLYKTFYLNRECYRGYEILSNEELFEQCKELKELGLVPFSKYRNHKEWFEFIKNNVNSRHYSALPSSKNINEPNTFMSIQELGLSVRTTGCLIRAEIDTLEDLLNYTAAGLDLTKVRGLTEKGVQEIIQKLDSMGLKLGTSEVSSSTFDAE